MRDVMDPGPQAGLARVLVAHDGSFVRRGLRDILRGSGRYEVAAEADDGTAIVDLYRSHRPDLVLVDLDLPGLDGIAATRALRALDPAARIVALSRRDRDGAAMASLAAGALDVLPARFAADRLLRALDLALGPALDAD